MNTSIVYKMTLIINYVFFQGENLGGCNNFLFELLNILYTSILWSAVQYLKKKKVYHQHICTGGDFQVNLKYQHQLNYFLALSVE